MTHGASQLSSDVGRLSLEVGELLGSGFRDLGFRVLGIVRVFRVQGFGGFGFWVQGFGFFWV